MSALSVRSGGGVGRSVYRIISSIPTGALWLIVVIWALPTLGLFANSFRGAGEQRSAAWWLLFRDESLTLDNYATVLGTDVQGGLLQGVINSFAIALPATVIPIAMAAFAAYAFAWMDFRGPRVDLHRHGLAARRPAADRRSSRCCSCTTAARTRRCRSSRRPSASSPTSG